MPITTASTALLPPSLVPPLRQRAAWLHLLPVQRRSLCLQAASHHPPLPLEYNLPPQHGANGQAPKARAYSSRHPANVVHPANANKP